MSELQRESDAVERSPARYFIAAVGLVAFAWLGPAAPAWVGHIALLFAGGLFGAGLNQTKVGDEIRRLPP